MLTYFATIEWHETASSWDRRTIRLGRCPSITFACKLAELRAASLSKTLSHGRKWEVNDVRKGD